MKDFGSDVCLHRVWWFPLEKRHRHAADEEDDRNNVRLLIDFRKSTGTAHKHTHTHSDSGLVSGSLLQWREEFPPYHWHDSHMFSPQVGGARMAGGGVRGWWVTHVHAFDRGPLVSDDSVLDFLQGAVGREPFPLPAFPPPAYADTSESYYEEAQPYGEPFNGEEPEVSLVPSQLRFTHIVSVWCLCCLKWID